MMLQGHGWVQQALLQLLRRRKAGADAAALARAVFTVDVPTRAQLESVRRALRTLRQQGLVDFRRAVHVMR